MSIQLRLLLAIMLILPAFLGLTGYFLDRSFNNYQLQEQQESMSLRQLLLARAADWDGERWIADQLDDPRFELPDSGLYAFITDSGGAVQWHSPSALSFVENQGQALQSAFTANWIPAAIGSSNFASCSFDRPYFCFAQRIAWGSSGPDALFLIVEDQAPVLDARRSYRQQLVALSVATTVFLLFVQTLVFHWGLAPLRRVTARLGKLERGEIESLEGSYPLELRPLTDNIGLLLDSEKRRRDRVRTTMDRLTHVLKSPLMLIRNSDESGPAFRALVEEQVERMLGVVEGELARARLDGRPANILGKPVAVEPVLRRIADAYGKLPRPAASDRAPVEIDLSGIAPGTLFRGEERDLQDLFGTLLENALKYARSRIEVSARTEGNASERQLVLHVADDGDGIPFGQEQAILKRGARADTATTGHGLGLAIVVEILSAYGGSLDVEKAKIGGACFIASIPQQDKHRK